MARVGKMLETKMATIQLHNEDCWEAIKKLEPNSVDAIITDPPYDIGFMGKGWDKKSLITNVEFWKECLRVLKCGGHLLSFGHSRTSHRTITAIEDAGFEIRDTIMWIYGSGFPKSHNVGNKEKDWEGWGSALKPAHEPVVLARKPLEGTIVSNVRKWGTGALNIDATRIGEEVMPALTTKTETTGIGWEKSGYTTPERTGRFPANVIFGHHEDCEEIGKTEETIIGGNKGKSGFAQGYESGDFTKKQMKVPLWKCVDGCPVKVLEGQVKNTAKFFYCPKVNKKERNAGLAALPDKTLVQGNPKRDGVGKELLPYQQREGTIGLNKPKIVKNNHPTIKPIALMEYLIKLVTREGGVVLDPFMGSGTTGIAAKNLNRNFIGCEREKDYYEIAQARIENWNKGEE